MTNLFSHPLFLLCSTLLVSSLNHTRFSTLVFLRASYASEHVNGNKFEESKKNAIREGKGGQPPSGGGNKKRLKSKKLTTGKSNGGDCPDPHQQQFQFQNNAHLSIHGHLPNGGPAGQQQSRMMNGGAQGAAASNMGGFPMVKDNNHSQANNNNNMINR